MTMPLLPKPVAASPMGRDDSTGGVKDLDANTWIGRVSLLQLWQNQEDVQVGTVLNAVDMPEL